MKTTRSNINLILFAGAMITLLVMMCMIFGSCTRTIYRYEPVDYQYTRDPLTYVEPFHEDTVCDHFFISMAVPIDSTFDATNEGVINEIKSLGLWPCQCIYCHLIKTCY